MSWTGEIGNTYVLDDPPSGNRFLRRICCVTWTGSQSAASSSRLSNCMTTMAVNVQLAVNQPTLS